MKASEGRKAEKIKADLQEFLRKLETGRDLNIPKLAFDTGHGSARRIENNEQNTMVKWINPLLKI